MKTHRLVTALGGPAVIGGILLSGLALGTASPAIAAPATIPACYTTGSTYTTPNAANPLTRPGQVGRVEPAISTYARPSACFSN